MEPTSEQMLEAKRSDRLGKKVGMVVCSLFSAVLIAVAVADTYTYYRAQHFWSPVNAIVDSKVLQYCGKGRVYSYNAYDTSPCWWVGVFYDFAGHRVVSSAKQVSDEARFRLGDQTRILVNPKNPEDFVFDHPLFSWVTYSVLAAVGLLFGYFAFWLYFDIRKTDVLNNAPH